jgi:SAM-dependent methyltransferase/GNAT superfamily N-acetyltransferase
LRPIEAGDYEHVIRRVDEWWGGRSMVPMLPRLFFTHFDQTSIVAADPGDGRPVGFLCGFRSQTDPVIAYIHFVGVDPDWRGAGLGRSLYEWFFERVLALGCGRVECVTSPINTGSRAFHAAMGFSERIVDDHDGRGEARVVLSRPLTDLSAATPAMPDPADYVEANMAFWDAGSPDYALDRFAADPTHLSDVIRFDLPRLGDVAGLRAVHLQCHIGTDTVSLARLGAEVTGLDLSRASLAEGRRFAARCGIDVRFVEAHVYDALAVLEAGSFDLVYTAVGALNWLPDIGRWAQVVSGLLRPGGRLHLREGHPVLWALADARVDGLLALEHPYFETTGTAFGGDGTYAETDQELGFTWTVEFNHGLGEIVGALLAAGLELVALDEHDSVPWIALQGQMEPIGGGEYRLIDRPERLPHSYTLRARKP